LVRSGPTSPRGRGGEEEGLVGNRVGFFCLSSNCSDDSNNDDNSDDVSSDSDIEEPLKMLFTASSCSINMTDGIGLSVTTARSQGLQQ